jgi:TonB family protein
MKTILFISIVCMLFYNRSNSQDTLFFNDAWIKCEKKAASFYRIQVADPKGYKLTDYFMNGNIQMTGHSISKDTLVNDGYFTYYDADGNKIKEGNYSNNKITGEWKNYYSDGQVKVIRNYGDNNQIDGELRSYYPNGKLKRIDFYDKGIFINGKCYSVSGADTAYFPYQKLPEFPGGELKRIKYFKKNLMYPMKARIKGIHGKVQIQFAVGKDGEIEDARVFKSVHKLLDEPALVLIKNMPRWSPGMEDGIPIKMQFMIPINFKL